MFLPACLPARLGSPFDLGNEDTQLPQLSQSLKRLTFEFYSAMFCSQAFFPSI